MLSKKRTDAETHSAGEGFLSWTEGSFDAGTPLDDFLRRALRRFSTAYMLKTVDQALVLFDQAYAHLKLKESLHAVDPVRRLTLLRHRLREDKSGPPSPLEFHREMTEIFVSVRDRHMNYFWPKAFHRHWAWLGFEVEEYWNGRDDFRQELESIESKQSSEAREELLTRLRPDLWRRYVITRIHSDLRHEQSGFTEGATIIYWNGRPMDRAVRLSAERQPGANEEAGRALGLSRMALLPLSHAAPPEEHSVFVGYVPSDKSENLHQRGKRWFRSSDLRNRILPWRVFDYPEEDTELGDREAQLTGPADEQALDLADNQSRLLRQVLHVSGNDGERWRRPLFQCSALLPVGGAESPPPPFGFTHLRVFSFSTKRIDQALREIRQAVHDGPQSGLVIDIRDNPGGAIPLAELLLQSISSRPVEPAPFQFLNSDLTLALCSQGRDRAPARIRAWQDWGGSIRTGLVSGEEHSQALPITKPQPLRPFVTEPWVFYGPVVLITNARAYSAADMFAAGFRDNDVGQTIGVHDRTGAGGANVVRYEVLYEVARTLRRTRKWGLKRLPGGVGMSVALRRSLRVRGRTGMPLEHFGASPDVRHYMTREDLLQKNVDLKARAYRVLMASTHLMSAAWSRADPPHWTVALRLKGIRVEDLEYLLLDPRGVTGPIPEGGIKLGPVGRPKTVRVELRGEPATEADGTRTVNIALTNVPQTPYTGLLIKARVRGRRSDRVVGGWVLDRGKAPGPTA